MHEACLSYHRKKHREDNMYRVPCHRWSVLGIQQGINKSWMSWPFWAPQPPPLPRLRIRNLRSRKVKGFLSRDRTLCDSIRAKPKSPDSLSRGKEVDWHCDLSCCHFIVTSTGPQTIGPLLRVQAAHPAENDPVKAPSALSSLGGPSCRCHRYKG